MDASEGPRHVGIQSLRSFNEPTPFLDYRFAATTPIAGEEKEHEQLLLAQGGFMAAYMFTLLKLNQTVHLIPCLRLPVSMTSY